MSNDRPLATDPLSKDETRDLLQKIEQEMRERADPIRAAIMDALLHSKDPRVSAIRRKSSLDQLQGVVECVALVVTDGAEPASPKVRHPKSSNGE